MKNQPSSARPIYIHYAGQALLDTSILNKESAFTQEERNQFNLQGLLPSAIETIEQQVSRAYFQFSEFEHALDKHIYLRNIQDCNETLFYRLLIENLQEMMPIIYTPTVGLACQLFSQIYRRKRGLFINYNDKGQIADILQNASKGQVKIIVVTDSERILGLGDQGIGGMGIPIGKLALYSACAGISPAYTMPVTLDVGTDNQQLLDDPMYLGWRHPRIRGEDYFDFVDRFVQAVKQRWPDVLIQFEDFAQSTATPLLHKYQNNSCVFNDDIQGTAAVTVGTILAACRVDKVPLSEHRIFFIGAGSAACGIAEQLIAHMVTEGLTEAAAIDQLFLFNRAGLLLDNSPDLKPFQTKFVKQSSIYDQEEGVTYEADMVAKITSIKPSIIIGVSGQPGLITQAMVEQVCQYYEKPFILPLSNPTSRAEAQPTDVIRWSQGKAMIATGSPFDDVEFETRLYPVSQCNNSYIFPGIGLGVIASGATRVTQSMFMVASQTLAGHSPLANGAGLSLLPDLNQIRSLSIDIAYAVAKQAIEDQVCKYPMQETQIKQKIEKSVWFPEYREYRRISL